MKYYTTTRSGSRNFLISYDDTEIVRVVYQKWYSDQYEIVFPDGSLADIIYKNFWRRTREVLYNNEPCLILKTGFKGWYISAYNQEQLLYKIRKPNFFLNGYTIENYKGEVVVTFTSKFRWFKAEEYIVDSVEGFGENLLEKLLLVLIVQFYRSRRNR